ncbi:NADH:flavin oxidoreductase/NADH oxidase family protein [Aerococcaceae bacterium NML191219]|nr:NADH:flavin oxidoreductase/NADH oxidase family protein [Aerococcaceae bacterium NML191219]
MNSILFTEKKLNNNLEIKNRFVKAAMNEAMGNKYLQPKEEIIRLYETWAKGGTGLIITGNVMVDPNYLAEPGNIVFDKNSNKELLRKWSDAGRVNGSKIVVQINHPGKQAPKTVSKNPVAPSAVPIVGEIGNLFNKPRELSGEEIKDLVQKFALAAKIAYQTRFDGVEIHAAHGYLINQFLSPFDNRRKDEYGGSIDNRMRFLHEIYLAMREVTSKDFAIGLKINSSDFKEGGFSEEDSMYVIEKMDKSGIDFIEVSGGSYENPKMNESTSKNKNSVFFADYSKKIKEKINAPVIVTGGIRTVDSMVELIENDYSDFIGLARPLAIEPNIPNLIAKNRYQTIETKRLSTGIKSLDKKLGGLIGLVYYQLLMQTYGKGQKPKITQNAWPALIHSVWHQGLAALLPQRVKEK